MSNIFGKDIKGLVRKIFLRFLCIFLIFVSFQNAGVLAGKFITRDEDKTNLYENYIKLVNLKKSILGFEYVKYSYENIENYTKYIVYLDDFIRKFETKSTTKNQESIMTLEPTYVMIDEDDPKFTIAWNVFKHVLRASLHENEYNKAELVDSVEWVLKDIKKSVSKSKGVNKKTRKEISGIICKNEIGSVMDCCVELFQFLLSFNKKC